MKEDEIVSAVARSAGISSNEHAEHAVCATLTVLGSRLAGGETSDLSSQLPPALAEALPASGGGEAFGIDEFYRRLVDVEGRGCTPDDARQHARAVVAALKVAVTPGEFEDVAGQLPDEYADLLATGPIKH